MALPTKQTAVRIHQTGGPEVLQVDHDVDVPVPQPDEVLIKVTYAGVNYLDTYHRSGLYAVPLPFAVGSDGTGVVVALGSNVGSLPLQAAKLQAGDQVGFISRQGGGYAQYVSVPASAVVKVPEGLDLATATAALIQGMTALSLVTQAYPTKAGDWLLVPAAAGGTGQLITQVAASRGAHVIALVSTPDKAELARSLGAEHVLLSGSASDEELANQVVHLAEGKGVHASIDGVGAATWEISKKALRHFGSLLSFGSASGKVPLIDIASLGPKAIRVQRPVLFEYLSDSLDSFEKLAAESFRLIASGQLKVQPPTVYALGDAAKAHADLQGRRTTGKLVLQVPH